MCDYPISRREIMRGAAGLGVLAAAEGIQLAVPPEAYGAVANPGISSCGAWGARSPRSLTVLSKRPSYIVIHHTATGNGTATTQAAAFSLARSIQNYHMNNNGWSDTGQQFTVSRGGYAMEGRHQSLSRLNGGTSFMQGAHVGAGTVNSSSIGIENEGTFTSVQPPTALWNKLIKLCAYICDRYKIPASKIYGHRDFMATSCPGNILYSKLPALRTAVAKELSGGGGGGSSFSVIVDNTTSGRFTASGNWSTGHITTTRYGTNYRYAQPVLASDAAWFKVKIPSAGYYKIDAWHPAASNYNNSTPYIIVGKAGNKTVHLNQRTNGGKWRHLGSFNLNAGDYNVVGVSRWTSGTGAVIADAIRVRK